VALGRPGSCLGCAVKGGLFALLLVVAALTTWGLVNVPPTAAPAERDHLTARDVELVRESQHLRATLGDRLWPGFASAPLPLQLYNDRYGFTIGVVAPYGYEAVADAGIDGRPYYRTSRPERQAFAVRIGDRWAGSIAVKETADARLPRLFREKVGWLARLIPYRLFIPSLDQYVGLVLHEQFHAFQAERNRAHFERARAAYAAASKYPWHQASFRSAWRNEVRVLLSALDAADPVSRRALVASFLAARHSRRQQFLADAGALAYEREVEWLEGCAKYVELAAWRLAAEPSYAPLEGIRRDPDFHGYRGYESHWRTERMSTSFGANLHDDVPFYYSGALQAMVLDRLDSTWKTGLVESGLFLDDVLSRRCVLSPTRRAGSDTR
jgi:hypothetical protein